LPQNTGFKLLLYIQVLEICILGCILLGKDLFNIRGMGIYFTVPLPIL
jgi:hypothetical protein